MKAVAYSVKPFEKEFLAKANQKKHDITLISNALSPDTAGYAEGKDAVIVFTGDDVSEKVVQIFARFGVKYIVTRSARTDHIDKAAAAKYGIKLANVPNHPSQLIPEKGGANNGFLFTNEELQYIIDQTIRNLDLWQMNKCVGKSCVCTDNCRAKDIDGSRKRKD